MKLRNTLWSLCSAWVLLFTIATLQQYKKAECSSNYLFIIAEQNEKISNSAIRPGNEATTFSLQTCSRTATTSLKDNFSNFNFYVKKYLKSGRYFYAQTFGKNVWTSLSQIPAKALVVLNCSFLI